MIKCSNPNCAAEIEPGSRFCAHCGTPVPQDKECPKCGTRVALDANFCGGCGYNFNKSAQAPSGGPSIGDKNVIAGDVVGSQENFRITGAANFIKNEDETKKVVTCSVCGKNVTIIQAVKCPECGKEVCPECYDSSRRLCRSCIRENEKNYSQLLKDVLADGVISLDERSKLDETARRLGISDSRKRELEKAVRSAETQKNKSSKLPLLAEIAFKNALELLYEEGNAAQAGAELGKLKIKFPENEEILTHYLYAAVRLDPDKAREDMRQYTFDSPGIDLARIDLALQKKDFYAAEDEIQSALSKWTDNLLIQYRQVNSLLIAFEKYPKKELLQQASTILESLQAPEGKIECSWFRKVKLTRDYLSGVDIPDITSEYCKAQELYTALTQPDIKITPKAKPEKKAPEASEAQSKRAENGSTKTQKATGTSRKVCPECGTKISQETVFCGMCGYNFNAPPKSAENSSQKTKKAANGPKKVCPECGTKVSQETVFCGMCGYNFNAPPPSTEKKEASSLTRAAEKKELDKKLKMIKAASESSVTVYIRNSFSEDKLRRAISCFAPCVNPNEILLHVDTTFYSQESTREGIIVTAERLYTSTGLWKKNINKLNFTLANSGQELLADGYVILTAKRIGTNCLQEIRNLLEKLKSKTFEISAQNTAEISFSAQNAALAAMNFFTLLVKAPDHLYSGTNIPEKKAKNLRKKAEIPADAVIFALYDSTAFGSAKDGVAFTSMGIYVHDDWGVSKSGKHFCSWEQFVSATKQPHKIDDRNRIDLGEETEFFCFDPIDEMVKILKNLREAIAESAETAENSAPQESGTDEGTVAMMINDDIKATSRKLLEMLEAMKAGKLEFVVLSVADKPEVFIQCCCNKEKGSYRLEYRPDANQYAADTDSFDALKDAMLKFYRYDFSFLEKFSWSLL